MCAIKERGITYNVTFFKDKTNNIFSKTFTVAENKLPLKLISGTDINETRVYGPDFSSTCAFYLEAPFLKCNADYKIRAAIIAINAKQPQDQITDDFTLKESTSHNDIPDALGLAGSYTLSAAH